jgi:hypothetical protein
MAGIGSAIERRARPNAASEIASRALQLVQKK